MLRKLLFTRISYTFFLLLLTGAAFGQGTPELLYYRFNGTGASVPNLATAPPPGTATATLEGGLTQGATGTCGGTALVGTGTGAATDYVNTGWVTNLTGSWTISFWTSDIAASTTLFYLFGDVTSGSFRCFTNGVAGSGNWILRGAFTDVVIPGAATVQASVTTFVYDSTAGTVAGYLNGVLVTTVIQGAPIVLSGTGPFKVGGYSSNVGLPANGLMDEFRFYSRALSAPEVASLIYGSNTTASSNIVVCGTSYESPSGRFTWTSSGTFNDTLTNSTGCDSIVTVNLTLKKKTASTLAVSACNSYKSPSGKYTWTAFGVYKDTIPNAVGCDSVITVNLVITNSSSSSISPVACNSYQSPSGKFLYLLSGNYIDTIPNTGGCDSIIAINLTIRKSSASTISPVACISYTSPSGKHTWTQSGNFTDTLVNAAGCDSIININLVINTVNISVTKAGTVLTASASGASYRWLDCNSNFAAIPGETNASFTAGSNGNYAVAVTENGCTDTSACFAIINVGINEPGFAEGISVYPNPTGGILHLDFAQPLSAADIRITNMTGQVIQYHKGISGQTATFDLSGELPGVYVIEVLQNGQSANFKLIRF